MFRTLNSKLASALATIVSSTVLLHGNVTHAESFIFGNNSNGLVSLPSATLISGASQIYLEPVHPGAISNESDSDGLGIDTSNIANVLDGGSLGDPSKFNIIDGTSSVSGEGEAIKFSFNHDGILQNLFFDGLKDETLEYFSIEFPDATTISFFDFEVELRLNNQSYQLSDLGVPQPTLANDASDDFIGLNYSFHTGEEFTITYREIDFVNALPGYTPTVGGFGNGARFQGLEVIVVPEPSSIVLCFIGIFLFYYRGILRC
mgnify:CR=1 FL=1